MAASAPKIASIMFENLDNFDFRQERTERILVTPDMARLWWTRRNKRPFSLSHAMFLAGCMERKEWVSDIAEFIKWDKNGVLIDGNHRIYAVTIYGKPVMMDVRFGLAPAAYFAIDQNKPRSTSDMLAISGEKSTTCLAAAIRMAAVWQKTSSLAQGRSCKMSGIQAAKVLEANPGIRDSVAFVMSDHDLISLVPASIAAFIHYLTIQIDPVQSLEFFKKLSSGEELKKSSPIWLARKRLLDDRISRAKLPGHHKGALVIKAWNFIRFGKEVKILAWKEDEPFPVPE